MYHLQKRPLMRKVAAVSLHLLRRLYNISNPPLNQRQRRRKNRNQSLRRKKQLEDPAHGEPEPEPSDDEAREVHKPTKKVGRKATTTTKDTKTKGKGKAKETTPSENLLVVVDEDESQTASDVGKRKQQRGKQREVTELDIVEAEPTTKQPPLRTQRAKRNRAASTQSVVAGVSASQSQVSPIEDQDQDTRKQKKRKLNIFGNNSQPSLPMFSQVCSHVCIQPHD
jgi:hypothetical protein